MGSRVLTACSFRSKSIPQQVFHRCRSAEALRLFRVPAVYLTSAFLWFFSILLFRRINNLRRINPPEGFDSHPGHQFLLSVQAIALCPAEVFAPFSFDASLIVPKFVPMDFRFSWTFGIYNTSVVAATG